MNRQGYLYQRRDRIVNDINKFQKALDMNFTESVFNIREDLKHDLIRVEEQIKESETQ